MGDLSGKFGGLEGVTQFEDAYNNFVAMKFII